MSASNAGPITKDYIFPPPQLQMKSCMKRERTQFALAQTYREELQDALA